MNPFRIAGCAACAIVVEGTVAFVEPARALETATDHPSRVAGLALDTAWLWCLAAGLLIGASTLFHLWYIAAGFLNLAPDEAHYWEWSRRLDWSYYSKGPVVAYLIAASTRLGGHTELWVRIPAVLLGAAAAGLAYSVARQLFRSERVGFLTVLIFLACPLFNAGSALMTTDTPLLFFWLLGVFALLRAVDVDARRHWTWWLLCGSAVGLGLLSKYTMAFFIAGCAIYLARSHTARRWLTRPAPYVALLLGIALFAPVVVWNAQHDWVSLRHVATLADLNAVATHPSLHLTGFLEFVGAQFGVISPLLLCVAIAAVARSVVLGLRAGDERHLLLAGMSAPLLVFLLLWSTIADVEPNWVAPAYATAFIATAAWWNDMLTRAPLRQHQRLQRWIAVILVPGLFISTLAHFSAFLPLVGIRLPARLDPTDRLRGWNQLGERVGQLADGRFLMATSYQIASELAFYTPGNPRVYAVNLGRRQSQYDIWGGLDDRRTEDALLVTNGEWPAENFGVICAHARTLDVVRVARAEQTIATYSLYACDGFKGGPNAGWPRSY